VNNVLRKEGRPAVNEQEWRYVQEQRWVEDALGGDTSEIVLNIVVARQTFGDDTTVDTVKLERGIPGGRKYALSLLLGQEARARDDVRGFRRKHLADEPLPIREVEDWVLQKAAADGSPTRWADGVSLPGTSKLRFDNLGMVRVRIDGEIQCTSLSCKTLYYPRPDRSVASVPVRAGGTLHLLHGLAIALANRFHWNEAEAVMFVLTDEVPPVVPAKYQPHWSNIPCLSRITLTVDPALSPRQVEALYRSVRGQMLDGRYRNLSRKHALLAGFTATLGELKLSEQMRKWNAQHPRWKYKLVTNFGRDAKMARNRLLAPSNLSFPSLLKHAKTKTR
jgi:hypothetical protein